MKLQAVRYPAAKGGQQITQQKPGQGRPTRTVKMSQGQTEAKRAMKSISLPVGRTEAVRADRMRNSHSAIAKSKAKGAAPPTASTNRS